MRRHDLVAETYPLREPQAVTVVLAPEEVVQVLVCAASLKERVMLTIGCGRRAARRRGEPRTLVLSDGAREPCQTPGLPPSRLASAMSSPTMPRRNNRTVTTKMAPWITSTHSPKVAR